MKFERKKLFDLDHCYAVSAMDICGEQKYFFAANNNNPCYVYDVISKKYEKVWEDMGGTMSMIRLPDTDGDFLAVHGFMPRFMAHNTSIAYVKQSNGNWDVKTLFKIPYIHRFDIFKVKNIKYILVCTISTSKKDPDDWSDPGKIWVGILHEDPNMLIELKPLVEGLTKNHGYWRTVVDGKECATISSENGVILVTPPQSEGEKWMVNQIIDRPVSEAAVIDIDGDGVDEIATIEPFHGDTFKINKNTKQGWKTVYQYPSKLTFGHVAYACKLRGVPTFIGGEVRGEKKLFYVQCCDSSNLLFKTEIIDKDGGPSNVTVVNSKSNDIILAANQGAGQAVMYTVTDS